MERAIIPSDQSVNATYHFQVNQGLRRYLSVVRPGPAACIGIVYIMITPLLKCILL